MIKLLADDMAIVSIDGVSKEVSVALIEEIAVGDYVILHVGHALAKIDPEEARETLDLLRQMGAVTAEVSP
ncbi:Hydrogenase expression/formation [Bradyrhizobium sp. BTAi1]|nr:Hydrogenase expression/formation [Bradyrhizobium sp. BTAi1]